MAVLLAGTSSCSANALVNVVRGRAREGVLRRGRLRLRADLGGERARRRLRRALRRRPWLERRSMPPSTASRSRLMASGSAWPPPSPRTSGSPRGAPRRRCRQRRRARLQHPARPARRAPTTLRGRAFTLIMGSNYAVLGLGMAAAGMLDDAVGARWVWGIAAGVRPRPRPWPATRSLRADERARRRSAVAPAAPAWPAAQWTRETLAAGVRAGDRRALARAITLVENRDPPPTSSSASSTRRPATRRDRRHRPAGRRQVVS